MKRLILAMKALYNLLVGNDYLADKYYKEFYALDEALSKAKLEKVSRKHIRTNFENLIPRRTSISALRNIPRRKDEPNTLSSDIWYWTRSDDSDPVPKAYNLDAFKVLIKLHRIKLGQLDVNSATFLKVLFAKCKTYEQIQATTDEYIKLWGVRSPKLDTIYWFVLEHQKEIRELFADEDQDFRECFIQVNAKVMPEWLEGEKLHQLENMFHEKIFKECTIDPKLPMFALCNDDMELFCTAVAYHQVLFIS